MAPLVVYQRTGRRLSWLLILVELDDVVEYSRMFDLEREGALVLREVDNFFAYVSERTGLRVKRNDETLSRALADEGLRS